VSLTIEDLKAQRRWVLWRLEKRDGKDTKVPYQISGRKASSTDPGTWATFVEVSANTEDFSGIGAVMGEVDGIWVSGNDIDHCYDPETGEFLPEARAIFTGLNSYTELSPSGTGCHTLIIGNLRDRAGLKEPYRGLESVELYDKARYLTFTGRHIPGTPTEILEREDAFNTLYDDVRTAKPAKAGIIVKISVSEEERLRKLMAGDISDHNDDHSTADFALCCLLAKKYGCNPFKIQAEFEKSGLYREKWERDDYRENTITRAITAVAREAAQQESEPQPAAAPVSQSNAEYPFHAWARTVVEDFALLASSDNNVPVGAYAEAFVTVLCAVMGDRVRCENLPYDTLRRYTLLVCPAGMGKGLTIERSCEPFLMARRSGRFTAGLLSEERYWPWKKTRIGAWVSTANSLPGLVSDFTEGDADAEVVLNGKKVPGFDPRWTGLPRVITIHEELKTLLSPLSQAGIGEALEGTLCGLFDRTKYRLGSTGTRNSQFGDAQFSLLGAVTREDWERLVSKGDIFGGGLMSRLSIFDMSGDYRLTTLRRVDFGPLCERFMPRVEALAEREVLIPAGVEAIETVDKWVNSYAPGTAPRANVRAWRLALLLSWLQGHSEITVDDAVRATQLVTYQQVMQRCFAVTPTDNLFAKAQAQILAQLERRGPLSHSDLWKYSNGKRIGTQIWEAALAGLVKSRQVGQEGKRYYLAVAP
jgi:hypothetical protein